MSTSFISGNVSKPVEGKTKLSWKKKQKKQKKKQENMLFESLLSSYIICLFLGQKTCQMDNEKHSFH